MEITLDQLCPGQKAMVTRVETDARLRSRLRDFGFIPRTYVRCRYRSPGGGVVALELRGSVLAIRNKDLSKIWGCC